MITDRKYNDYLAARRTDAPIGNHYGNFAISEDPDEGKFFWGVEDYNEDFGWEEISEELYNAISSFLNSLQRYLLLN